MSVTSLTALKVIMTGRQRTVSFVLDASQRNDISTVAPLLAAHFVCTPLQ